MDARSKPTMVVAAGVLALAATGCWPAPGQGPDRSAYNPFETVITPTTVRSLTPVWTATLDTGGGMVGPPVVSNAGVHVTDTAAVHTFDAASGAPRWRYPESSVSPGWFGDPLADGDRVLYTSGSPVGFGGAWLSDTGWLDARTGAFLEDVPSHRVTGRRGSWLASYARFGGPVVGLYGLSLQVQDLTDPESGWSRLVRVGGAPAVAPPATLGRERLYYAGPATVSYEPPADVTGVRAFPLTPPDPCTPPPPGGIPLGPLPCPLWATPTAAPPVTSPVLGPDESVLYVGTSDGTLLALDAGDGHVRWTATLGAAPSADPAVAEGWLYVPLANGRLVALPAGGCGAAACDVAWWAAVGGAGRQPAVAGGLVFVGTDAGQVVALRAAGCGKPACRPLWRRGVGGPVTGAPAVTNGHLYVGVSPNRLVAFAPS